MKLKFFIIPIHDSGPAAAELEGFLSTHRVARLDRQFVADAGNSAWAICVTYLDPSGRPATDKRGSIDYREVLPAPQFLVYSKLRTIRKELADKEGLPAYALFTNEQLAEMVRRSVDSIASLKKISGIGSARADKYGAAFIAALQEGVAAPVATLTVADPLGPRNGNASGHQPR